MGDVNRGNIQLDTLEGTGVEEQQFMCLIQDNFLFQHVLEPTRGAIVVYLLLSSQRDFVDYVITQEPLGWSDHNQLHFNINIKSDKTKGGIYGKASIRKWKQFWRLEWHKKWAWYCYLKLFLWNSIGNGPRRNICQKRFSKRLYINTICGGCISIRERIKIMTFTKRH